MFDGGGLYIEVTPSGAKYWRLKYRYAGKEKRLALGVFSEVSLTEAREGRDAARAQLRKDKQLKLKVRTRIGKAFDTSETNKLSTEVAKSRSPHIYMAFALARKVASQIEQELQYPGQIKVTIIRETRCVEVAK